MAHIVPGDLPKYRFLPPRDKVNNMTFAELKDYHLRLAQETEQALKDVEQQLNSNFFSKNFFDSYTVLADIANHYSHMESHFVYSFFRYILNKLSEEILPEVKLRADMQFKNMKIYHGWNLLVEIDLHDFTFKTPKVLGNTEYIEELNRKIDNLNLKKSKLQQELEHGFLPFKLYRFKIWLWPQTKQVRNKALAQLKSWQQEIEKAEADKEKSLQTFQEKYHAFIQELEIIKQTLEQMGLVYAGELPKTTVYIH